MKYELRVSESSKVYSVIIYVCYILFPVVGYLLWGLIGILIGFVLAFLMDTLWPRWVLDYPIENLKYTLQVFLEHGLRNGLISCRWEGGRRAGFYLPYFEDEKKSVPKSWKDKIKIKISPMEGWGGYSTRLMFRAKEWESKHGHDIWERIGNEFNCSYTSYYIDGLEWIGYFTPDVEKKLQILRQVTGTNRIPYVRAMIPMKNWYIFASTDGKGDRMDGFPDMRKSEEYWKQRRHKEKMEAKLERKRKEQREIDRNRREAEAMQQKHKRKR
ncbi:MAG: hypothetical protein GXO69_09275 [Acidobacteria bacterium]|nr:hypothetical protein [Acidobacteriota bacterium]